MNHWHMNCHWPNIFFSFINFFEFQVEKIVRNGYKTTKQQLTVSIKEIIDRTETLVKPLEKLLTLNMYAQLIESININKAITLNRQCERFLRDLLNTLADHQIYIESYLKNFRIQLNKIHEIVKFRTAIPITSIFVSKITLHKHKRTHSHPHNLCIHMKE